MTPFPGPTALLPCLSTTLLIYATAGGKTWIGRLLSTKPFVGIGKISYSLYLWHWPVIVLLKYQYGLHLGPIIGLAAIAMSFLLGYLSWRYIETPFRTKVLLPTWGSLVSATATCAVAIVVISGIGSLTDGLPMRWNAKVLQLVNNEIPGRVMTQQPEQIARNDLPKLGVNDSETQPSSVLLWGDSHAMRVFYPCDELAQEYGLKGYVACRGATIPLLDTWRPGYGERRGPNGNAVSWNREVVEFVRRHEIKHVILAARWGYYVEALPSGNVHDSMIKDAQSAEHTPEDAQLVLHRGLQRTIDELEKAGAKTWIIKQVPLQTSDPIRQLVAAANRGDTEPPRGISLAEHLERQENANTILERFSRQSVGVLDPAKVCFDQQGRSIIGTTERSYYFDDDHLSPHGAKVLLRPILEPVFREIANEQRMAKQRPTTSGRTEMR